jgi:predicted esterase
MEYKERLAETITHGRYLVNEGARGAPLLTGFHGQGESAEMQFDRLKSIAGEDSWIVVSIQGLHRFYRGRSTDVVASWMTRQDREVSIADNIRYTVKVIDSVAKEYSANSSRVMAGFSQGVSMAFRCAAGSGQVVDGVIALGGDIPPELDASALSRIRTVFLARGTRDEWYSAQKMTDDERRLREAGVRVQVFSFDAGHEWTPEFAQAAARYLREIR